MRQTLMPSNLSLGIVRKTMYFLTYIILVDPCDKPLCPLIFPSALFWEAVCSLVVRGSCVNRWRHNYCIHIIIERLQDVT